MSSFKCFSFLVALVLLGSNAEARSITNAQCSLKNQEVLQSLENFDELNTRAAQTFKRKASLIAKKLFSEKIGGRAYVAFKAVTTSPYDEMVGQIYICDNEEEGQGNCLGVTFGQKRNGDPKAFEATEDWHIGEGKTYNLCNSKL